MSVHSLDLNHLFFEAAEHQPQRLERRRLPFTPPNRESVAAPTLAPSGGVLDPFLRWLLERSDLDPDAYRPGALQRRLPACMRKLHVGSGAAARALLEQRPELLIAALSVALIGVSEFFRDPLVFDQLHRQVLPELLRARAGLRVLGIGVADGRELYSVAMLLAELGALDNSRLLGIDCRRDVIEAAASGRYCAKTLGGVSTSRLDRHFLFHGSERRVRSDLRARVEWKVADLLSVDLAWDWDLILFRNVAIYLQPSRLPAIWKDLASRLQPGGFLLVGKAERPSPELPLKAAGPCLYRKTAW